MSQLWTDKSWHNRSLYSLKGALLVAGLVALLIFVVNFAPAADAPGLAGCLSRAAGLVRYGEPAAEKFGPPRGLPDRQCGTWQANYTRLHERILAGELPPRFAVSVAVEAGLADRLTGIITEFYYALLTGRAFQITPGNQPAFEAVFRAPHVNWSRPNDPDSLVRPLNNRVHDAEGSHWGPDVDTKRYGFWYLTNTYITGFFRDADLRTLHKDAETVFISSNRGGTHMLFSNPFHRKQLLDWGLRPDTAFACAYEYLFSPRVDLYSAEMKRELQQLEEARDAVKIGIMVRVGDQVFEGLDNTSLDVASPYLRCASEIERHRAVGPKDKVLWYFMSESLALRKAVKERYGDKVITNVEEKAVHPDCQKHGRAEGCSEHGLSTAEDKAVAGLLFAVAQLHAFSKTDYQVFTLPSGFGRLGAWLSATQHQHPLSLYSIDGKRDECAPSDADDLRVSAEQSAGV